MIKKIFYEGLIVIGIFGMIPLLLMSISSAKPGQRPVEEILVEIIALSFYLLALVTLASGLFLCLKNRFYGIIPFIGAAFLSSNGLLALIYDLFFLNGFFGGIGTYAEALNCEIYLPSFISVAIIYSGLLFAALSLKKKDSLHKATLNAFYLMTFSLFFCLIFFLITIPKTLNTFQHILTLLSFLAIYLFLFCTSLFEILPISPDLRKKINNKYIYFVLFGFLAFVLVFDIVI